MAIPQQIKAYLNGLKIPYEVIHHRRDFTAQETARDTHTPGRDFAKTIVLYADNDYYMMVLPATYKLDLQKIKTALGWRYVDLATEEELAQVCADCEVGAMPPLGRLYNMKVFVDRHLTEDHLITFNAGTHEDVIRLRYDDFNMLSNPNVIDIARS
jgi:Ala-tRNA(Pro) deacylase